MQDIQSQQAEVALPIDRVGIRNLKVPLQVSDRQQGSQHTVAVVELGVDLPAAFKGTHMSRFIEAMQSWTEDLSYASLKHLLEDIKTRLQAQKAQAVFAFPFFLQKRAPSTGEPFVQGYDCRLTGELVAGGKPVFLLEVVVPVMTVCPCSKAISKEGAHSQRAEITLAVRLKGFTWLEEFIVLAEASGSSPTYPLLKREDEKEVTEQAFANPCFVEDVVRSLAHKLEQHNQVTWFRVEVESFESIHAHNAFAWIERAVRQAV